MIYECIKKFKEKGIIKKFMVILDLNVLGFSIFVFICIKVKVGMYGYVVD